MNSNKIQLEKYTAYRYENIEVRNYGGNGYNVYFDGVEIDYFTLISKDTEIITQVINEKFNEILFDNLF